MIWPARALTQGYNFHIDPLICGTWALTMAKEWAVAWDTTVSRLRPAESTLMIILGDQRRLDMMHIYTTVT